jgi:hypothetical protein
MSDGISLLWALLAPARVPHAPQSQWSSDVIEPVSIVGCSNIGPLMLYDLSLLWVLSATTRVPRAPQYQLPSNVIEPIAIIGGSSNGMLMFHCPSLLWALAATTCSGAFRVRNISVGPSVGLTRRVPGQVMLNFCFCILCDLEVT